MLRFNYASNDIKNESWDGILLQSRGDTPQNQWLRPKRHVAQGWFQYAGSFFIFQRSRALLRHPKFVDTKCVKRHVTSKLDDALIRLTVCKQNYERIFSRCTTTQSTASKPVRLTPLRRPACPRRGGRSRVAPGPGFRTARPLG